MRFFRSAINHYRSAKMVDFMAHDDSILLLHMQIYTQGIAQSGRDRLLEAAGQPD